MSDLIPDLKTSLTFWSIRQLTDSLMDRTELLTDCHQCVRHLSVITIIQKPVPLSRGLLISSNPLISTLDLMTNDIISFYYIVQTIDSHHKQTVLTKKRSKKLKTIFDKAAKDFPKIFQWDNYSACVVKFDKMIMFYTKNFDKLNWKLEPKIQRR